MGLQIHPKRYMWKYRGVGTGSVKLSFSTSFTFLLLHCCGGYLTMIIYSTIFLFYSTINCIEFSGRIPLQEIQKLKSSHTSTDKPVMRPTQTILEQKYQFIPEPTWRCFYSIETDINSSNIMAIEWNHKCTWTFSEFYWGSDKPNILFLPVR